MIGEYIILEGTQIKEHCCGPVPDGATVVPTGFAGAVGMDIHEFDDDWHVLPLSMRVEQGFVAIPEGFKLSVSGNDFLPMNLEELVGARIIELMEHETLEGTGDTAFVRQKTEPEMVRDGLSARPKGVKVVEGKDYLYGVAFLPMTLGEQVAAGDITQQTADVIQATNARAERDSYYKAGDDAILGLNRQVRAAQKSGKDTTEIEAKIAQWDAYNQALADVPEQGGFPWHIEWPTRPDGIVA